MLSEQKHQKTSLTIASWNLGSIFTIAANGFLSANCNVFPEGVPCAVCNTALLAS